MGNRIADIGKMKSMVDGENRLRARRLTKRAKLGTEKNPAVVHVRTEQRLKEIGTGQAGRYHRSGTFIKST